MTASGAFPAGQREDWIQGGNTVLDFISNHFGTFADICLIKMRELSQEIQEVADAAQAEMRAQVAQARADGLI